MFRLIFAALILSLSASALAQSPQTRSVILVTVDGLRWQEVFGGMDPTLKDREDAGMADAEEVRKRFWADAPEERRRLLMPFFWGTIAERGVLLGNRNLGSAVNVTNRHRFSYPGYSEILTGRTQDDAIASNELRLNPSLTVLEVLQAELRLPRSKIAVFASWKVFRGIVWSGAGDFLINAGYEALELEGFSPRIRELSQMQHNALTPWRNVRHDYFTFELGLEYLTSQLPRITYFAFGEPDDWAHDGRYDRVLETVHYFDECLNRLWAEIQSNAFYQGSTTMIITTDHGRGRTAADWRDHGSEVDGAEEIWLAAIGPETEAIGEARDTKSYLQADVAPTILQLLGVDYLRLPGVEGDPLPPVAGR